MPLRGINLCGPEFGQNAVPGVFNRDYTYNSERSYEYFASKGLGLVRLPLMWERLQPRPGEPIDEFHLGLVQSNVAWAKKYGATVVLDLHNFGRYGSRILDTHYELADFWLRISAVFRDEPAVYAYGLMNEPHDMGAADWKRILQDVLTAIRAAGDTKLVMAPGLGWSGAEKWFVNHGPSGWIEDPAANFAYEAHTYFDRDNSGRYLRTYDEELARDPDLADIGPRRLRPFVEWCRTNRVRGYLGEYGIPGGDPRWLAVLDTFLRALDDAGFDGTYWAAGEWWGDYPLSVQPRDDFTTDAPQLSKLRGQAPQPPNSPAP